MLSSNLFLLILLTFLDLLTPYKCNRILLNDPNDNLNKNLIRSLQQQYQSNEAKNAIAWTKIILMGLGVFTLIIMFGMFVYIRRWFFFQRDENRLPENSTFHQSRIDGEDESNSELPNESFETIKDLHEILRDESFEKTDKIDETDKADVKESKNEISSSEVKDSYI